MELLISFKENKALKFINNVYGLYLELRGYASETYLVKDTNEKLLFFAGNATNCEEFWVGKVWQFN